jgi:hypothetical protein
MWATKPVPQAPTMTAQPLPALASGDPSAWEQALYAFLIEKGNRSGSRRTVESYGRMLWPFFADRGLTPDRVKPANVLAWVHGPWSGCESSRSRGATRMCLKRKPTLCTRSTSGSWSRADASSLPD